MLVLLQGQLLAFDVWGGIAAVGHITLAYTLTRYADRADHVVASTIYPAICAVADRRDTLEEIFVKSNRAAMIWMVLFCAAIVLFAPTWSSSCWARTTGSRRWSCSRGSRPPPPCSSSASTGSRSSGRAASRARRRSRPAVMAAAFLAFAVPGLALWGATGFVVGRAWCRARGACGRATCTVAPRAALGARLRGSAPVAVGAAGRWRSAGCCGRWPPALAGVAELLVFLALTALATRAFERDLLREFAGYLRTGKLTPAAA